MSPKTVDIIKAPCFWYPPISFPYFMEIVSPLEQGLQLMDENFQPLLKMELICLQVGGKNMFLYLAYLLPFNKLYPFKQ